jgi:hypothetical protein
MAEYDFTEEVGLATGKLVMWQHDDSGRIVVVSKDRDPGPEWSRVHNPYAQSPPTGTEQSRA